MADDDKLDSHKHRRKKTGTPEWSETCIGFWSKTYKEIHGKENEEQRRCRGISILHLNKVYHRDCERLSVGPIWSILLYKRIYIDFLCAFCTLCMFYKG